MSRIVEVIGATVTSPRNSKAELLVGSRCQANRGRERAALEGEALLPSR